MQGEAFAILAALAYGLASVTIQRSKQTARGDNGVFLSVVVTAGLSALVWLGWGTTSLRDLVSGTGLRGVAFFALAGICANVIGRQTMYRATGMIGPVRTGLLRRLTPVFAVPVAFLILGERSTALALAGGALVLAGVLIYMRPSRAPAGALPAIGLAIAVLSPLAYALAYSFRSIGMTHAPDAAFGTMLGAVVGLGWLVMQESLRRGPAAAWTRLTLDRAPAHWLSALLLSIGQILQFFALKTASVTAVAIIGTLDTLFAALIVLAITRSEQVDIGRLLLATALAMTGTGLLVWS